MELFFYLVRVGSHRDYDQIAMLSLLSPLIIELSCSLYAVHTRDLEMYLLQRAFWQHMKYEIGHLEVRLEFALKNLCLGLLLTANLRNFCLVLLECLLLEDLIPGI